MIYPDGGTYNIGLATSPTNHMLEVSMKKFELCAENKINWLGRTLFQIRALISFETGTGDTVSIGDLGGWIEKEENLSHDGSAWVYDNAKVWGNAEVYGNAKVWGDAQVWGNAEVFSTDHILSITPIGPSANVLTVFRTKDLDLAFSYGWKLYTLEEFENLIAEQGKKYKATTELALKMARIHIDLATSPTNQ